MQSTTNLAMHIHFAAAMLLSKVGRLIWHTTTTDLYKFLAVLVILK